MKSKFYLETTKPLIYCCNILIKFYRLEDLPYNYPSPCDNIDTHFIVFVNWKIMSNFHSFTSWFTSFCYFPCAWKMILWSHPKFLYVNHALKFTLVEEFCCCNPISWWKIVIWCIYQDANDIAAVVNHCYFPARIQMKI